MCQHIVELCRWMKIENWKFKIHHHSSSSSNIMSIHIIYEHGWKYCQEKKCQPRGLFFFSFLFQILGFDFFTAVSLSREKMKRKFNLNLIRFSILFQSHQPSIHPSTFHYVPIKRERNWELNVLGKKRRRISSKNKIKTTMTYNNASVCTQMNIDIKIPMKMERWRTL